MMKMFERIGLRRAASELRRMGYADLAANLEKQLKELG
jgi:hypothetical protein